MKLGSEPWLGQGQVLTWAQVEAHAKQIWPDDEIYLVPLWEDQFIKHCEISNRTFSRWKAEGAVSRTVSVMLNAFVRLRQYGLPLPGEDNENRL